MRLRYIGAILGVVLLVAGCNGQSDDPILWGDEPTGTIEDQGPAPTPGGMREACTDPNNPIYDDPDCVRFRQRQEE